MTYSTRSFETHNPPTPISISPGLTDPSAKYPRPPWARRLFSLPTLVALLLVSGSVSSAQVVINEVDYDQEGTDSAEFIELYNSGAEPADLDNYLVELINGSSGTLYQVFDLPDIGLAPGGYFVICTDPLEIEACDMVVGPPFNWLQNGAPDAVALWSQGVIVDTVSYEGETADPYTEGPFGAPEDESSEGLVSIGRFPDGLDGDRNDQDFTPYCATPGRSNADIAPPCFFDEPLELSLSGDCPGEAIVTIKNGSGGGTAALLMGPGPGSDPLLGGPCAGQASGLADPSLVIATPFDVNGNLVLTKNLSPEQCAATLQAVDPTTCKQSKAESW